MATCTVEFDLFCYYATPYSTRKTKTKNQNLPVLKIVLIHQAVGLVADVSQCRPVW